MMIVSLNGALKMAIELAKHAGPYRVLLTEQASDAIETMGTLDAIELTEAIGIAERLDATEQAAQ